MAFHRLSFDSRTFMTEEPPMADRLSWTPTDTTYPPGTSPFDHYVAYLGTEVSPPLPAGTTFYDFPELPPGDYPSALDTVAVDGTILRHEDGPMYHVEPPVIVPVGMGLMVARVP
jgi:hypothetical protein